MKKILIAVISAVLIAILAVANWDKIVPILGTPLGVQPPVGPGDGGVPLTLGMAPPPRVRAALIDPTTSTEKSFREQMKEATTVAVQAYVPPKPSDPKFGVPAVTGLQLTVRLVATNSLAYGQQNIAVSIPSVPALPARPDLGVPGVLDPEGPLDTWKKSEAEWSAAYDAAVAAGVNAVQSLGTLNLDVDESSGVTAGAAALALLAPAEGDIHFAVFSDLDENRPQQPANFHGHPLLVVQPDPVGDIGRWDSLFNEFSSWASASGAGTITRVRPEAAPAAITTFISGT